MSKQSGMIGRGSARGLVGRSGRCLVEPLEDRRLLTTPAFDLMGLTAARADPLFSDIDGTGVSVAVIDTGLDRTHPLLSPNYRAGFNFINNTVDPIDTQGHGTHVSGTVGARNTDIGVAPDVGLIGLRVFPDNGGASNTTIQRALQWVLDNRTTYNIVAVNMSLGAGFYTSASQAESDIYVDEIRSLEAVGVTVVSAAGNSYKDHEYQNAASPGIVSSLVVGAVWQDGQYTGVQWGSGAIDNTTGADRITSFSQRINSANSIFAPGAIINSTYPGNRYNLEGGTSMASPMVAGSVALLQEASKKFGGRLLTTSEVVQIITGNTDPVFDGDNEDDNVVNTLQTYKRINVHKALQAVKTKFDGVGGGGGGSQTGDANGTLVGAARLYQGDSIGAAIGSDGSGSNVGGKDVDIYRFDVAVRGTVTLTIAGSTTSPADFDSFLRLFDFAGAQLTTADDGGSGKFSRLEVILNPGTYFVGVSGFANTGYNPTVAGSGTSGALGNYVITYAFRNEDTSGTIGGAEDSDLGDYTRPTTIEGRIGSDNGVATDKADVDLYKVAVPDDGTLLFDIDTPYDSDFTDVFIRLFNVNGVELDFNDDGLASDLFGGTDETVGGGGLIYSSVNGQSVLQGHSVDSFLIGTVTRGGVYYIGVSHFSNDLYNPVDLSGRPASSPQGRYKLTIKFKNNDVNGSIPQAVDDDRADLPISALGGRIGIDGIPNVGNVTVGDRDVDVIALDALAGDLLSIEVKSYSLSSNSEPVDTVIFLFDRDGVLLASVDDTEEGLDPSMLFRAATAQTVYLAIVGYGNDSFDPFLLGSGSPGDTGYYELTVQAFIGYVDDDFSDDHIGNQYITTLTIGETRSEEIGSDGTYVRDSTDVDVFKFTAPKAREYEIRTGTSDTYSADTFLRVFDADGNELGFNDDASTRTTSSYLRGELEAGQLVYVVVSGASPLARSFNPLTPGTKGPTTKRGEYSLSVAEAGGVDSTRFRSAAGIVESVGAGAQFQTIVSTINAAGRPITFQLNPSNGVWNVQDLSEKTQALAPADAVETWVDPKDGRSYAMTRTSVGMVLYTSQANGGWAYRTIGTETGGAAGSTFSVLISRGGAVFVMVRADNGELILYSQTGGGTAGNYQWSASNISRDHLQPQGLSTPQFVGGIVSYATSWNGLTFAGLDSAGVVWGVWWAPGLSTWTRSNLSEITGAPAMTGALTTYVTSYDAVNIIGADASGSVLATWWLPGANWQTSNLTQLFNFPKLQPVSLASYVTPWDGTNITGIEADGTVSVYWWSPGQQNWQLAPLSAIIPNATKMVGSVRGVTTPTSGTATVNLIGASADGDVIRYFWSVGDAAWSQQNLTQIAVEN